MAAIITDSQKKGLPLVVISSERIYACNAMHPAIIASLATGGLKVSDVDGGITELPDFTSAPDPVSLAASFGVLQVTGYFHSGVEEDETMKMMPHSHTERWCESFVDIVGNGTSKALGLEVMGKHFGFDISETMAIGDGANDIPMIKAAGWGVAMGNASDTVKSCADAVTDDVDCDGLAKALEKVLKQYE